MDVVQYQNMMAMLKDIQESAKVLGNFATITSNLLETVVQSSSQGEDEVRVFITNI